MRAPLLLAVAHGGELRAKRDRAPRSALRTNGT